MTWWDRLTDTEAETVGLGLMFVGIGLVFFGLFLGKDNKNYIVLTGLPMVMTGALAFGISKKNAASKSTHSTPAPVPTSIPTSTPIDLVPPLYLKHISSIHKRMGVSPLCSAKAPLQPVEATQAEIDHFKQINLALEAMRRIR
jgi:hypothetical protein